MIDLANRTIDIVNHLEREGCLGERTKGPGGRKGELRFGTHGSLAIVVSGAGMGDWHDHELNVGGGPAQLIKVKGGYDQSGMADWLRRKLGIDIDKPPPRSSKIPPQKIVATYDYVDEAGALLFQVVRYGPRKTFSQRAPDGKGGWLLTEPDKDGKRHYTRGNARLVPYHLDELVAAKATGNGHPWRVYIVEGEKDADRLRKDWGVVATTSPGGASKGKSKWLADYNRYFSGSEAIIVGDNDVAGRAHVLAVAAQLAAVATVVRVVELGGLDDSGDISNWMGDGGTQGDLEDLIDGTAPYVPPSQVKDEGEAPQFDLGEWDFGAANISATELSPRGWLLGNWLCRQFVSSLVGDGGVGKTAHRILCALSLATGRGDLLDEHVFERVPVLFVCFEDGETELKKRICAAMLHWRISNEDIKGYLFVRAVTDSELKLATADDYNKTERGPLIPALDTAIVRRQVGAVFLDPLVKTHGVNENSNNAMDLVVGILADLGIRHDVAVDATQHVSKGLPDPGNADRGRGASAVKDAGRLVYTMCGMSLEEAKGFGLEPEERRSFVRIDPAKVNLTPGDADAKWFKLVGVPLGNTWDPRYPRGDTVHTLVPWTPPDPFKAVQKSLIATVFAAFRDGPGSGEFYSFNRNADDRWGGKIVMTVMGKNDAEAGKMLAAWKKSKTLLEGEYMSPRVSHARQRIIVDEAKAGDILGALYQPPADAE